MKKLLSIAVASFAVAAVAVDYSPTIGVTQITTTNKNTIVAVPFNSLVDAGNISVTDLVCTNGLAVGTQIYVFKNNGYKGWVLQPGGWTAATSAGEGGVSAPAVGDGLVASPGAIWVILTAPPAANEPKTFCIYGQYTNVTETAIAAGANNLVANPLQSDATVALTGTPAKGDVIIIPSDGTSESYSYGRGGWVANGVSFDIASITVKMGQGFWYVSKTGSGVSKITWSVKTN